MRLCKGLAVCWRFGFSGAPREARALDVPRKELKTEVACLLFRQKCTRFSDTGERLIGRLMRATLRGTCRQHGGRQDHELIGCRHEQQPTHVGTNIEIGIGDVVLGLCAFAPGEGKVERGCVRGGGGGEGARVVRSKGDRRALMG